MSFDGFEDVYLPDSCLGALYRSSPRTSTTIVAVSSGHEHRNRNFIHPLWKFSSPEIVRCHDQIEDLKDHWLALAGPHIAFPFRDMMDFASRRLVKANLEPSLAITDQVLGIGDGATTDFQLIKTYTRGARSYARDILLPRVDTVIVGLNAAEQPPSGWSVTREGGVLSFDAPPAADAIVTAGYLFDVPVRFEDDDSFEMILKSWQVDGAADLTFPEVRVCELVASS